MVPIFTWHFYSSSTFTLRTPPGFEHLLRSGPKIHMASERLSIRTSISPECRASRKQGVIPPGPRVSNDQRKFNNYDMYDEDARCHAVSNTDGYDYPSRYPTTHEQRRDSRNDVLPDTPPYRETDASQRPVLPPLKSVSICINLISTSRSMWLRWSIDPGRQPCQSTSDTQHV